MAQGMKEPQKEDLFANDYGKPIKELIEGKGSLQGIVLDLFSKSCEGEYENYLGEKQVGKIIGWLEQNWEHVQKNVEGLMEKGLFSARISTKEQLYYALGFLIGGQYCLGNYTDYDESVDSKELKIKSHGWGKGAGYNQDGSLDPGLPEYNNNADQKDLFTAFLDGICTGAHDYAHNLRYFNGEGEEHLGELAVALVMSELAVPLFHKDARNATRGMRDPLRLVEQIENGKIRFNYASVINNEYLEFIVAPWIGEYLRKKHGKVPRDFILGCETVFPPSLIATYHKKWEKKDLEICVDYTDFLNSIPYEDVKKILTDVLENKIREESWENGAGFFKVLFRLLDDGFGVKPKAKEAKDGFIYLTPKKVGRRG